MSERTLWWVPLYPFAALGLWAAGTWSIIHTLGVTLQDVYASTGLFIGVMAVLVGQMVLLLGHEWELIAAREGREWWFESEVESDD